MTSGVQRALSNAWLKANGLFSLEEKWSELAPLRRTAVVRIRMQVLWEGARAIGPRSHWLSAKPLQIKPLQF